MRPVSATVRLSLTALLVLSTACDRASAPSRILGTPNVNAIAPARSVRVSANPPCTHHWKTQTDPNRDWFADTNWVEGSVPSTGSSVCIDNGKTAIIGTNWSTAGATVAAVTVSNGGLSVQGSGSSLTVSQNLEIAPAGVMDIQGDVAAGSSAHVGGTFLVQGWVQTLVKNCTPCATAIDIDANVVLDGSSLVGIVGTLTALGGDLTLSKIGGSLSLVEGSIDYCCGAPSRVLIPASALGATVDFNGGSIRNFEMQTGTFTHHRGSAPATTGILLNGANLVFAGPDGLFATLSRGAGVTQTISGNPDGQVTIVGSGAGTSSTVQFLGSPSNLGKIFLSPQAGEIVNLTGALTNTGWLQIDVATGGAAHLRLNLVNTNLVAFSGSTFFDQSGTTFENQAQLLGSGTDPLVAGAGTTLIFRSGSFTSSPSGLELRGSHLVLEESASTPLKALLGSSVDLGTSFHQLNVGDYVQDATSTLALKVGGLVAGTTHDQLLLGTSTLGGTLAITTVAPFVGGVCGQLPILIGASSITGTFAAATGLTIAPTRSWGPVYTGTQLVLRGFDPTQKLNVAPNPVAVTEGVGNGSYSLCLSKQPTADVNVALGFDAQVASAIGPGPVQVPLATWWQPQPLGIFAVDDAIVEPQLHTGLVTHTASSTDPFFNGAVRVLTANVTDNDGNADLALTIPTPPPPLSLNQTFNVGFRDRDIGPTLSTGATFTVPATPAFRFVSATGATCAPSGGNLVCQVAGVASGGQVNFTLTFKAVQRGTFQVTLTLTGQQPDPNGANNVQTRSITVN